MRRRSGFTLVEVLVAMALTLFIMSILSAAFVAATQAFTDLKSAGDLAERVGKAANVLKRDLEADHIYADSLGQSPIRLHALWSAGPNQPPPAAGFFRIFQGAPDVPEGTDLDGIPSYYQTQACLHYTIGLNGNKRSDFLSATIPANSPLINGPGAIYPATTGNPFPDNFYQDTAGTFNSQTAEVAVFLVKTGDLTDGTGTGPPQPLYALYRRQFLPVPMGWAPQAPFADTNPPSYLEMSTVPTAGEANTNLTFNALSDLSKPVRRFWMSRLDPAGAFLATGNYARMGQVNQGYMAADLLLTDVVSFDVRILLANDTEFRDLYDPKVQVFSGHNQAVFDPAAPNPQLAALFDTWTNKDDALTNTMYAATWNSPWQAPVPLTTPQPRSTIPLYQTTGPSPSPPQAISIQAIQIVVRVWDFKTKKTRQATIVQQM